LFGEKVDEDKEFAPGTFVGLNRSDSSSEKTRRLGVGLKDERVLDDMEILNSIMSISKPDASKSGEKRRFGLGDERFNDDERDRRILGALSQSEDISIVTPPNTSKNNTNGITALRLEKFNDDNRDAKLLSLLKESDEAKSPLKQSPSHARASQGSQKQPFKSGMSTLSSSDLSPRKRASTNKGRFGASTSGSYVGQFSNRTNNGPNEDTSTSPIPSQSSPMPSFAFNDPKSGSPLIRDSRILAFHTVPIDVELEDEKPWRSDSGLPRSSKTIMENGDDGEGTVDSLHEERLSGNQSLESTTGTDEDLDQILALLAHEDA
jgi:hypothetical protein